VSIRRRLAVLGAVIVAASVLVGCAEAEARGHIDLVYVEWDREPAITYLVGEVLSRGGYSVSVTSVSNPVMWAAVAAGEADAHLSGWMPDTHRNEWEEHREDVVDLGPNYTDATLGLVVPRYIEDVRSIDDLVANAERFDNLIIGIDPGAGMMQQTAAAIERDLGGLGAFELVEGSDSTMVATLGEAIERRAAVVVTGWDPHVKFVKHELRTLEDPYGIYGDSETINTVVRTGLEQDHPEVFRLLSKMDWEALEGAVREVMLRSRDGIQTLQAAGDVAGEYRDEIESAVPDGFFR